MLRTGRGAPIFRFTSFSYSKQVFLCLCQVWAGASDEEVEGVWRTDNNSVVNVRHLLSRGHRNFHNLLQHLPWAENRPYNDGYLYNCLAITSQMTDIGDPHYQIENLNVVDEV